MREHAEHTEWTREDSSERFARMEALYAAYCESTHSEAPNEDRDLRMIEVPCELKPQVRRRFARRVS